MILLAKFGTVVRFKALSVVGEPKRSCPPIFHSVKYLRKRGKNETKIPLYPR